MMLCVVPIYLISYATAYWHFLVLGLFVGMAGGSFSVGTPYVARWFSRERQGFAMGIYGAGNSGAAVNKFVAPALIVAFGWTAVPQVYSGVMLGYGAPLLVVEPFRSGASGRFEGSPGASNCWRSRIPRSGSSASTIRSFLAATSR
jgi:nitrate/nitrite transporter NarK